MYTGTEIRPHSTSALPATECQTKGMRHVIKLRNLHAQSITSPAKQAHFLQKVALNNSPDQHLITYETPDRTTQTKTKSRDAPYTFPPPLPFPSHTHTDGPHPLRPHQPHHVIPTPCSLRSPGIRVQSRFRSSALEFGLRSEVNGGGGGWVPQTGGAWKLVLTGDGCGGVRGMLDGMWIV